MREWLPNPLSVWLGPATFGLPYRRGKLSYAHTHESGCVTGTVTAGEGKFCYAAHLESGNFGPCPEASLDEFLMERYTAFTCHNGTKRFFRIWHEPWPQTRARVEMREKVLLTAAWDWLGKAELAGSNYSPGVRDVWMGWPHRIRGRAHHRAATTFLEMP